MGSRRAGMALLGATLALSGCASPEGPRVVTVPSPTAAILFDARSLDPDATAFACRSDWPTAAAPIRVGQEELVLRERIIDHKGSIHSRHPYFVQRVEVVRTSRSVR